MGISFYNPSFFDMSKLYKKRTFIFDKFLLGIFRRLERFGIISSINIENSDSQKFLHSKLEDRKSKLIFIAGWPFRVDALTMKYHKILADNYSLKQHYFKNNKLLLLINSIDRERTTIVGVHIRRGDYKDWHNGKYYFDDKTYQFYTDNLKKELSQQSQKKTIFIIFSDEPVSLEESSELIISKEEWYIDHLIMSNCDYLIGPPSTFTAWASFVGKIPYYHILDKDSGLSLDNFTVCQG
jgi:hypothetical protein